MSESRESGPDANRFNAALAEKHRLRAMRQAMVALTDADTFLTETHKGDYLCGKLALTIHKAMVALECAGL